MLAGYGGGGRLDDFWEFDFGEGARNVGLYNERGRACTASSSCTLFCISLCCPHSDLRIGREVRAIKLRGRWEGCTKAEGCFPKTLQWHHLRFCLCTFDNEEGLKMYTRRIFATQKPEGGKRSTGKARPRGCGSTTEWRSTWGPSTCGGVTTARSG